MARPPITWLITDTHFYHNKMVSEVGWPADYLQKIIGACAFYIASQDILFHLGDVIFYKYGELNSILGRIPGRKILLRGNHDRKSNGWFMRNGFDFVADQIVLGDVIFSHKPLMSFPSGV